MADRSKNFTNTTKWDEDGKFVDPKCPGLYALIRSSKVTDKETGKVTSRNDQKYRSWSHRFSFDGKPDEIIIGTMAKVTLADARKQVYAEAALIAQGINPNPKRNNGATAPVVATGSTWKQDYETYHNKKQLKWSMGHSHNWLRLMANHTKPIHDRDTATLTKDDIIALFSDGKTGFWFDHPEAAMRLRGMIEVVLEFVMDRDGEDRFPRGNVAARVLSHPKMVEGLKAAEVHHPAPEWEAAPAFYQMLAARPELQAKALRMVLLTCTPRRNEVVRMKWSEIDFAKRIWTVPGERVKGRKLEKETMVREIPLSQAAIDLLAELRTIATNDFVFPGGSGPGHLYPAAPQDFLREVLKSKYHQHGLRATFKTWVEETFPMKGKVDSEAKLIKMAHAQKTGNKVDEAYGHMVRMRPQRMELAEIWAAYLTTPVAEALALAA